MNRRGRSRVSALAAATAVVTLVAIPATAAGKTVHITKSDSAGNAVQGATFTLYVDAPPVGNGPPKGPEDTAVQGSCTTGANGQCDITNVPPGDYWVSETGPPPGYVAAPDSTLKVKRGKKQVFEVVVVDDKKPANRSVNDPTGDTSYDDGTHVTQFGPAVATSPNGRQVFIAFNDSAGFFAGGFSAIGFAYSSDGGRTWEDRGQVPTGRDDSALFAQPTVVFDPVGNRFVVAAQAALVTGQEVSRTLAIARYAPAQNSWSHIKHLLLSGASSDASLHDPWLTVDFHPLSPYHGSVYLGATLSAGGQAQGLLSRSTNGGRTWTDLQPVTDLRTNDFLNPVVAPNGDVYVSWTDFGGQAASTNDIFVSRSTDGGRTFSRAFSVAADVPKSGTPGSCGSQSPHVYLGAVATADAPRIAVDPADPARVFVVFTADGAADESDVLLTESSNGGRTWTTPAALPYQAGVQMFPDIEVTPEGRVGVSYYEAAPDTTQGIDFVMAVMDVFGRLGSDVHAVVPMTDDPFGLWNMHPGYDSFYGPCFGMQGNQMTAPGSGFFVSWTDGGDPGPAGNGGVDPNIDFARFDPSLATTTTLRVDTGGATIRAAGSVTPDPFLDARVTLTLFFDDGPGGFEQVDRARPALGPGGTFAVTVSSVGGTCRLVARFDGSEGRLPSSVSETFDC